MKKITKTIIGLFILSICFIFIKNDSTPKLKNFNKEATLSEGKPIDNELSTIEDLIENEVANSNSDNHYDFKKELVSNELTPYPEGSSEPLKINDFKVNPNSEILSKRDRTSKHYLRDDGKTIDAILSPKSLHYKNESGEWKDIDTKLVPSQKRDYIFTNKANNLQSWFPPDLTQYGVFIKADKTELVMGQNLTMSWADKQGKIFKTARFNSANPDSNNNVLTYKNVLPNISNQYVVMQDEIKHNIILEEKPLIPEFTDYVFFGEHVELPEGHSLQFDDNLEGLEVLDELGQVYLQIPAPVVYEENNETVQAGAPYASFQIEQLAEPGNKYQIITKVSAIWLDERTYPVIIDPTLILNGNTSGYIWSDYERYFSPSQCGYVNNTTQTFYAYNNTNAGAALNRNYYYNTESTWCYRWYHYRFGGGSHWHYYYKRQYFQDYYRGWIKYNTSSIPDDSNINSVEFSANISGGYAGNLRTYIYSSSSFGNYTTTTNSSQYNSIGSYYHGQTYYSATGQYGYLGLNSDANNRLQNLLASDYFQIGLQGGNTTSGTAQLKYFDTANSLLRVTYEAACQEPAAICKNITAQLDAAGNVTIAPEDVDDGSTAECGLQSMSLSKYDFTCDDEGENQVTLTVIDINGAISTCQATVTVEDNVLPVAITKAVTVQLDAGGNGSITASDVDNGSSDACGIKELSISPSTFDCTNVGPNTVTLTVTDNNNNVSTETATVTVEDNVLPVAMTKAVTVQLDAGGNGSITASDVDNGSSDACGIKELSVSPSTFDCTNVGPNTVTLTVTDNNNNVSTETAIVTVEDNVLPVAMTKAVTVQLDAGGNGSITASDVDNGSSDACGIKELSVSPSTFDCTNVGPNTVTLTVTDNNNNVSTETATVTVEDNVLPTAMTKAATVQLDAGGNGSITASDVDNGSSDACGIKELSVSPSTFDCTNVGPNTVTLTVTDNNNNVSTETATVTVEDNVLPTAMTKAATVQLDAGGNGSITASDVDNGSSDACGINELSVSPSTFDCTNVGPNTVTLTVTDNNNNISTETATVTVEDNVLPTAMTKAATVQLDAGGNGSITASDVDNGSSDACGIKELSISPSTFDCTNVGPNTVTLTVTDNNNNVSTETATVTVEDNVLPVAMTKAVTVQLDAGGNGSITASDVDNGSSDACGIKELSVSPSTFDCTNVGPNTVTLTVTDNNNNVSTETAIVTVEDNVLPVAMTKAVTVQLDAGGNGSITASDVDNGSSDACGIKELSVSPSTFDCTNVGPNTVTLTVTDNNNNVSTETATVTVEDNVLPTAMTKAATVQLDAGGNGSITASDVDNGSSDACGIKELSVSPSTFDCTNVGPNTVTLTVTDNNNNVSTETATVTVEDNVLPTAMTKAATVQLDAGGNGSITASDVDNGSSDACGIKELSVSPSTFDCTNVGPNTVTLTVTDNNNNVSTETATVTVEDNVLPTAMTKAATVQLDAGGNGSITASDVDNGSSDACGIKELSVSPSTFDCTNVGPNTVTLTVTDNNNNISTETATVTVEDNVLPLAICQNLSLQLDENGLVSVNASDIDAGSSDSCGIASILFATDTSGGEQLVTNGSFLNGSNGGYAWAKLNIDANAGWQASGGNPDQYFKLESNGSGQPTILQTLNNLQIGNTYTITGSYKGFTTPNSNDPLAFAVDLDNINLVQLSNPGMTWVSFSATFQATAVNQNISFRAINGAVIGVDTISSEQPMSFTTTSSIEYDCSNLGDNEVTLLVTDVNGNISTCTSNVLVEDNIVPVITCQEDANRNTDPGACTYTIVGTEFDATFTDNCDDGSITNSINGGPSLDGEIFIKGDTTVTWTVDDGNGQTATCTTTITVEDNENPVISCVGDDTRNTDTGACTYTIVGNEFDATFTDNCDDGSITNSINNTDTLAGEVFARGETMVTWTVDDGNGQTATCTTTVTVEDNEDPVISCPNNVTTGTDSGLCSAVVNDIAPTGFNDNCAVASVTYQITGDTTGNGMDDASGTSFNFGTSTVTYTVIDESDNTSTCSFEVIVDNVATVSSVTVSPGTQQYSDKVTFEATLTPGNCTGAGLAATGVTFYVGSQEVGSATLTLNGNDLVGELVAPLLETPSNPSNSQMAPGTHEVIASFTGVNANYTVNDAVTTLKIEQEDAVVEYTGQTLQATPNSSSSEATIVLSANIQDIAVTDPADNDAGDIRNAKVKFVDREGSFDSGWIPVINLVDLNDNRTGTVSYNWLVDIGSQDSESFTIGIIVDNGYYIRNSGEDDTVVTVYVPNGDFITGGGYIIPNNSAGEYASTDGLKTNFGFNVKYNKKGKKLKGHMNIIFRRLETDGIVHVYQIKSNAVQSLGVDISEENGDFATFITKSNLKDITDPLYPVSLGGNLILKVDMTDMGEPGSDDSISFNLTNSDGILLYSSSWTGISTDEMQLSGGNLVVHSGFSLNGRMANYSEDDVSIDIFEVNFWPNPSDTKFNITVLSPDKSEMVKIYVFDMRNRVVHKDGFNVGMDYQFGEKLQAGLYVVRIHQGETIKTFRLMKR